MPGPGHPLSDLITAGLLTCSFCDAFPLVAVAMSDSESDGTYSYGHSSGFAPDSLFKDARTMCRRLHRKPLQKYSTSLNNPRPVSFSRPVFFGQFQFSDT